MVCWVGLALLRVIVTPLGQSPKGKRHQHGEVPQGVMPTSCICHLPTFLSTPSGITGGILGLGEDFGSSCLYHISKTLRKTARVGPLRVMSALLGSVCVINSENVIRTIYLRIVLLSLLSPHFPFQRVV